MIKRNLRTLAPHREKAQACIGLHRSRISKQTARTEKSQDCFRGGFPESERQAFRATHVAYKVSTCIGPNSNAILEIGILAAPDSAVR